MIDNFAVFILTHGRPNNVKTYDTLKRQGYTGPIYIIIDNEDKTADEYKKRFGDKVIVFDKADIARRFDTGDNFKERRSVFFARNASFEIARDLGIEYFLQLDDDYNRLFHYLFDKEWKYWQRPLKSLDNLFRVVLDYYKKINALTIALAQGGDLIGGGDSLKSVKTKRKAMNTFFCSIYRPFEFVGRVNEDVNTYTYLGNIGELILTVFVAKITQNETQSVQGGMSELYLNEGTYRKSFYSVMYRPSCVKISMIGGVGSREPRLHHKISWNNAVPCIVRESLRKRNRVNNG